MDFGDAEGFYGLLGSDLDARQKLYGSGLFKQLGRPPSEDAHEWRLINSGGGNMGSAKVAKSSDDCSSVSGPVAAATAAALPSWRSGSNGLSSDFQRNQRMLCFSSPSSPLHKSESQPPALPCFSYASSVYSNYAGLGSGGLNGGHVPGMVLGGGRGPFTPSQWVELEHQALIYKYINANIPVPSNLLIPIRKAFDSPGFCYGSGLMRPNLLRWGGFQLGFSNSTDPEPGRCRRTDGKKWRCSREAVADQKYCERHMNRGRHRSRKPVEGLHLGHPVSGGTTTTTTAATFATATTLCSAVTKGLPVMSAVPVSGASESSFSHFQSGAFSLPADSSMNRFFMGKENPSEKIQNLSSGFSIVSPSMELKSTATPCLINSSLHRTSALSNSCRDLGILKDLTDRQAESNHLMFMSDWLDMKVKSSDTTHLSISTPMASSDNKVTLWPLRSTNELDQVHRQTMNWIPISWETSMGGPLGEVLHSANNSNSSAECKDSSALNLMSEGWEGSFSSALRSSPTGVLQKTAFSSVSNSSAGSSPRADENRSKLVEGAAMSAEL